MAATSSSDVWVIGGKSPGNTALIEHWDGHAWRLLPNPSFDVGPNLRGIVAFAPNNAWVAGSALANNATALVEHWDGRRWAAVPVPQIEAPKPEWRGYDISGFTSLAASGPHDIWASGGYENTPFGLSSQLMEHFDGTQWRLVRQPVCDSTAGGALAVLSATNIWVIGDHIGHWDGHSWQCVPSPLDGKTGLHAISAVSSTDIWVVGELGIYLPDVVTHWLIKTMIEHWDGHAWRLVPSPNVGGPPTTAADLTPVPVTPSATPTPLDTPGPPDTATATPTGSVQFPFITASSTPSATPPTPMATSTPDPTPA